MPWTLKKSDTLVKPFSSLGIGTAFQLADRLSELYIKVNSNTGLRLACTVPAYDCFSILTLQQDTACFIMEIESIDILASAVFK